MVTGPAAAFTTTGMTVVDVGLAGLPVLRVSGMMLIPGSDSLGRSDAEVCAEGVVDASEAGAGFLEGLVDVNSVVGTETTGADSVVLSAVAEGTVEPGEPALFGVGLATAEELDEMGLGMVVVRADENVGVAALGMLIVGKRDASVERLVSDDFPGCPEGVTLS